jgi:hypothetical protein
MMSRFRHPRLDPAVPLSAPVPVRLYPDDRGEAEQVRRMDELCALFGAVTAPAMPQRGECFVYLLMRADRFCLYAGHSVSLTGRLAEHRRTFGAQVCAVQVIRCVSEHQMLVRELLFIDELQPPYNTIGTRQAEYEARARRLQAPYGQHPRNPVDPYAEPAQHADARGTRRRSG